MPYPKQILAGQDSSVKIAPEKPGGPVPAVPVPVAPDAAENSRSENRDCFTQFALFYSSQ